VAAGDAAADVSKCSRKEGGVKDESLVISDLGEDGGSRCNALDR
jgi:hypothetical protein